MATEQEYQAFLDRIAALEHSQSALEARVAKLEAAFEQTSEGLMERATGFEPATKSLGSSYSTN